MCGVWTVQLRDRIFACPTFACGTSACAFTKYHICWWSFAGGQMLVGPKLVVTFACEVICLQFHLLVSNLLVAVICL